MFDSGIRQSEKMPHALRMLLIEILDTLRQEAGVNYSDDVTNLDNSNGEMYKGEAKNNDKAKPV